MRPKISNWLGVVSCLALDRLPNRNACIGIDPTVRGLLSVVSSDDGSCGGKTRSASGPNALPSTGRSVGMHAQMTAALSSAVDQLATKIRSHVMSFEEGYWFSQMVRRTEMRQTLGEEGVVLVVWGNQGRWLWGERENVQQAHGEHDHQTDFLAQRDRHRHHHGNGDEEQDKVRSDVQVCECPPD